MKKILAVLLSFCFSSVSFAGEDVFFKLEKNNGNIVKASYVDPGFSVKKEGYAIGTYHASTKKYIVDVEGESRSYIEFVQDGSYKNKDLIIVLHGGGGSADKMMKQTIFTDLAKSNNLVILFLNAKDGQWNDGREKLEDINDISFVRHLVPFYKEKDVNKIMVAGFSNGAIMGLRLACENIPNLNYFGIISGSLPTNSVCKNPNNKNIIMVNGTNDNFVKWDGGEIPSGRELGAGGYVVPVEKTLELWKTGNKCTKTRVDDIDINFSDESSVERESYKCEKGALSFFKINGGGHTIPGGKARATLSNMVGNTNKDISTERELIKFLKNNKEPIPSIEKVQKIEPVKKVEPKKEIKKQNVKRKNN